MSNYRRSFRKIISERFAEVPEFNTGTSSGYIGSQGDIGYTGSKGDQGIQGPIGYTGSAGITPEGGSSVTVSATSPVSVSEGDLWFDSENLETYVYYSNNWVVANPTVSNPTTGGATALEVYANSSLLPTTNNTDGDFAFVQDTKSLYIWDGTEWKRMQIGVDETLYWLTEANDLYDFDVYDTNGISIITAATDPEGFDITYSYDISPTNTTAIASVTESNGTFTVVPNPTHTDTNTEIYFRTKASDGIHIIYKTSTLGLELPAWQNVQFLLGVDPDTNAIIDKSNIGNIVTVYGNAAADNVTTKYSSNSVYFDGSGDYLRADDALANNGINDPLTIETWIYFTTSPATGGRNYWVGGNTKSGGANQLILSPAENWINGTNRGSISDYLIQNRWHHIAYVYDGIERHTIYVDGVDRLTYIGVFTIPPSDLVLGIGTEFDGADGGSPGNYFTGYIENYQVTKYAKYTSVFTPPAKSFSKFYQGV